MIRANRYRLVDGELVELLKDEEERKLWLLLEPHPDFEGQWAVQSLDPSWFFEFKDLVGAYRVISPATLGKFLDLAEQLDYRVAFFEDPIKIIEPFERLNEPPEVSIHSTLPGNINGLLPFQVQGFNFLKDLDGGVALWDTGTGKMILAIALMQYHLPEIDLGLYVVKAHNKTNVQRALKTYGEMDSILIDGSKKQREILWKEAASLQPSLVVTNYEKFRTDAEHLQILVENRRVAIIWDEMPTKLKTRGTQLYRSVCEVLYTSRCPGVKWDKRRPSSLKQWMLSATPIENDPEDWFNAVRLLDPRVYGTVQNFHSEYVTRFSFFNRNQPEVWQNLDRMGLKAAHITHKVDKSHPEIAEQFPNIIETPLVIDWDSRDRKIYDLLMKEARSIDLDEANILALITVAQMLCDAPSMVKNSADLRLSYEEAMGFWAETGGKMPEVEGSAVALQLADGLDFDKLIDDRHTKVDTLRELLTEDHANEKILVFSHFNERLLPILAAKLKEWGVPFVRYFGNEKERQVAQDAFMNNPDVRVFLSSDIGSDSLSLEQASVVIHYDLPWKWSTYIQRQNRIHRVVSEHQKVRFYTLMMADSVEDRKMQIIQRKMKYHNEVFQGAIAEQAESARMTAQDLRYILLG